MSKDYEGIGMAKCQKYADTIERITGNVLEIPERILADDGEVTEGEGEPIHRLKQSFPNEASAQAAAKTARDKSKRRAGKLEITMPGDPNMMAECPVFTWGLPGISFGNWIAEQVTHTISDQGYSTSFTAVPQVDG